MGDGASGEARISRPTLHVAGIQRLREKERAEYGGRVERKRSLPKNKGTKKTRAHGYIRYAACVRKKDSASGLRLRPARFCISGCDARFLVDLPVLLENPRIPVIFQHPQGPNASTMLPPQGWWKVCVTASLYPVARIAPISPARACTFIQRISLRRAAPRYIGDCSTGQAPLLPHPIQHLRGCPSCFDTTYLFSGRPSNIMNVIVSISLFGQ